MIIDENTSLLKINKHFLDSLNNDSVFEQALRLTTPGKIELNIHMFDMIEEILKSLKYNYVIRDSYYNIEVIKKENVKVRKIFKDDEYIVRYRVILALTKYESKITIRTFGKTNLNIAKRLALEITDYLGYDCAISLDLSKQYNKYIRKNDKIH